MESAISSRNSIESAGCDKSENVGKRPPNLKLWRPSSIVSLISNGRSPRAINSVPAIENVRSSDGEQSETPTPSPLVKSKSSSFSIKRGWNTIVSVVIVEAKGLPGAPEEASHTVYCKISLGSTKVRTKSVPSSRHPEWRERSKFRLNKDHLLRISIWDKGKMKNFMGSCVVDLTKLEKERTHEIWQELEDGFGSVHLNVTICSVRDNSVGVDDDQDMALDQKKEKFALFNLGFESNAVGQLHVKVIAGKGLSGRPNAFCILEVDNERIQTPSARTSPDPDWNKSYTFNVYDVTSSLDLKVYNNSIATEFLGKLTIPLLRINNGEACWYALKDRSKRNSARGNCPRILLEMSLVYNPVKATLRLFQPKEEKYIKKPPKFDVPLVHSNLEFMRDALCTLAEINECYKRLFEWETRELSAVSLVAWLVFWSHFQPWMGPLLLLIPFLYFWMDRRNQDSVYTNGKYYVASEEKNEKSLANKIQGLPELTISITSGVEYMVSLAERLYNLVTFKVPLLSYLTMIFLVIASVIIHYVPFKYLLMLLGVYKYTRKQLNPERRLNNDLLDFISRIPDNAILKDWKELSVPEPNARYLVTRSSYCLKNCTF